jgi:hypothetical protein
MASRAVLARIEADGLPVSVRDYHTQNVLRHEKLPRVVMTGCPALYDLGHGGEAVRVTDPQRRVTVSMGVRFAVSDELLRQVEELVEGTREAFPEAERGRGGVPPLA